MDYEQWMREVNRLCEIKFMVSYDEFPDLFLTRDIFESGITPEEFVEEDVTYMVEEEFGFSF